MAVAGLFREPGVGRVWIMPSPSPPHKPTVASTEERVQLTRLAFGPSQTVPLKEDLRIELCELERASRHPGRPTYTFDTLMELRSKISPLAFVIGSDQFHQFPSWHRFPEVLSLSHWIILERKGAAQAQTLRLLAEWQASGLLQNEGAGWRIRKNGTFLQIFPTPAPELSSTLIRQTIAKTGQPPENSLLPEVQTYLMQRGIYGTRHPSGV